MTEQTEPAPDDWPSRRAGLRDQLADAIHRYDNHHALSGNDLPSRHHRGEADAVLTVLYREWPWLRAEAEDAAIETAPAGHREQLHAAIESELYEYRERTMWWPEETGGVTKEIARLATRGAIEVRDQEMEQLRAELDRAHTELRQYTEGESADAAAGSYAGRAERVEAQLDQVRAVEPLTEADRSRDDGPREWADYKRGWNNCRAEVLAALDTEDHAIAHPEPWLHVLFTSPDPATANTSALVIADHLAAEFDGVSMQITSNAVGAGASPICELPHMSVAEEEECERGRHGDAPSCSPAAEETEPDNPELTAEETRDLADELSTDLYKAQDALAFVEECCVIADREQRNITTADVRTWLKGAQCGRQLAADGGIVVDPAAPPLEFVTWSGPVNNAEQSPRTTPDNPPTSENTPDNPAATDIGTEFVRQLDHPDEEALAKVEADLAQSGVDIPGCDCGHDGMGISWHGDDCPWRSSLTNQEPQS